MEGVPMYGVSTVLPMVLRLNGAAGEFETERRVETCGHGIGN
jgi:hypothetical protein